MKFCANLYAIIHQARIRKSMKIPVQKMNFRGILFLNNMICFLSMEQFHVENGLYD